MEKLKTAEMQNKLLQEHHAAELCNIEEEYKVFATLSKDAEGIIVNIY